MPSPTAPLLDLLDQAYGSKRAWHGTSLKGALRGVTPAEALRRPGSGRHNIWELVVHIAYWKYAVTRLLLGIKRGSFPRTPANWPAVPARPDLRSWKSDLALLDAQHKALRRAVAALPLAHLKRKARGRWTFAELVVGVGAHDLYHLGQIQLIKRLVSR